MTNNNSKSIFSSLYKYTDKKSDVSQEERRRIFLNEQKEKRHSAVDKGRDIDPLFEELDVETNFMEYETHAKPGKPPFKFELMSSEYFTDIPDDLEENWLIKLCPKGLRVLLIAKKHKTLCYTSRGKFVFKSKTNFPGGSPNSPNGTTVLDCIYNKTANIIFVLDCLYWNNMSMLDCEASFRFTWLESKFTEIPELCTSDKIKFMLLPQTPAERTLLQSKLENMLVVQDFIIPYDGVTFYHKESHYTFGYTPLVAWLWAFMLEEKLGIYVSPENKSSMPDDYVCVEKYLEGLIHKKKRRKLANKMDVS